VKNQQAQREAAENRVRQAVLRGGFPGMPPMLPAPPADDGFAVADLGESQLPLPPEMPVAPMSRGNRMAAAADEDIASLFGNRPPAVQGGPAAPPTM
jgi:hypothetical protein